MELQYDKNGVPQKPLPPVDIELSTGPPIGVLVAIVAAAIFVFICFTLLTTTCLSAPTGLYVMQAVHSQNVKDSVILSPSLTGFHVRDEWDLFEPRKGVFDYTFYDTQLSRAARLNKQVTIGLYSGASNDPNWGNSPDEFAKAVAALGTRYGSNPRIDAVHLSAPLVTDHSQEMYLPSSWHGTTQQAIDIWDQSIDEFNQAFPTKTLVLDLALVPDQRGAITKAVDEYARAILGSRFSAIVCNLKAGTDINAKHIVELERLRSEGVTVGAEMVGPSSDTARFGGSFSKAMSIGNSLGCQWYQIYQVDVTKSTGLRVASVPEPPPICLLVLALLVPLRIDKTKSHKPTKGKT